MVFAASHRCPAFVRTGQGSLDERNGKHQAPLPAFGAPFRGIDASAAASCFLLRVWCWLPVRASLQGTDCRCSSFRRTPLSCNPSMPSPPPAPRRGRTGGGQSSQVAAAATRQPARSNGFDSSDDMAWHARASGGGGDNTDSFTFGDGGGRIGSRGGSGQAVAGPSKISLPGFGSPGNPRAAAASRGEASSCLPPPINRYPDADHLMARLTGRPAATHSAPSPVDDGHLFARNPESDLAAVPGAPGPSRARLGPSHARLSNSSSFASSPGPLRRVKTGGPLSMLPSTPTGARMAGLNADGSYSVVRDDEDANNSGLLDLGPQSSLGRNGDLFGFHKAARGTPNKSRTQADAFGGHGGGIGDPHLPSSRLSDPPLNHEDTSIVEHSLADVPESDEVRQALGMADDDDDDKGEDSANLLRSLRLWRQDAMEHHLYDTAAFWGEKVLCMETDESQRCNDAYFLAKAYFLTHQYSAAERLLTTPLPSSGAVAPSVPQADALADEGLAEQDALQAAVDSTRKATFLPSALLERSSGKPNLYAGAFSHADDGEDGSNRPSRQRTNTAERKRKDREFTVSGTGTGSESDAADAGGMETDSDDKNQPAKGGQPNGQRTHPKHRIDFRRGGGGGGGATRQNGGEDSSPSVTDAWRQEQLRSLSEVQAQHNAAISGHDRAAKPLANISAVCRFLAAKCMVRLGKFGEALDLVGEESGRWIRGHNVGNRAYSMPSSDGLLKVGSSMSHLRGLIHLRLDDLDAARAAFLDALRLDVKNYDAFAALVDGRLIEAGEVWTLIESLQWDAQSNGDRQSFNFIRLCYTARLGKEEQASAVRAAAARRALWDMYSHGSSGCGGLYNSLDLLYSLAEDLHARRRFADSLIVTRRILDIDSEHEQSLDLHISNIASSTTLHANTLRPQLFLLANRLVEEHPDRATSWYAVGTWYSILSRWTDARAYFSKATLLNPRHLPSWLAFANSFAKEGESEQAILAYSSVIRNFPDHRYAKVCLGAEHVKSGNLKLARVYLGAATRRDEVGDADAELGVLLFYEGRYDESIALLERCLEASAALDEPQAAHTTTRLNLAWAYRKANRLHDAKDQFHSVVELEPDSVAAYVGLGMVDHALGNIADAVGWYHEALSIDPRHSQATELLQTAMDEYARVPVAQLLKGAAASAASAAAADFPPEAQPVRLQNRQAAAPVTADVFGGGVANLPIPQGPDWLVSRPALSISGDGNTTYDGSFAGGSGGGGASDRSHLVGVGGRHARGGDGIGDESTADHEGSRSMLMDESG